MAGGTLNEEKTVGSGDKNSYLKSLGFEFRSRYTIDDLLVILKVLRSENGCPWDKVQTHESIRTDLIEETYEVCEGIDRNSPEILREELGDLLMQVVFHTEIETEAGNFNFDDVCNDVCQKLVFRHPHVFGNVSAETEDEVLRNWDALKKVEKEQNTVASTLESVPKTLPALLRGEKICRRVERANFPLCDADACINRIKADLDALNGNPEDVEYNQRVLGQLLLNVCNLNRIYKVDGEKSLTYYINGLIEDFTSFEEHTLKSIGSLDKLTKEKMHKAVDLLFGNIGAEDKS